MVYHQKRLSIQSNELSQPRQEKHTRCCCCESAITSRLFNTLFSFAFLSREMDLVIEMSAEPSPSVAHDAFIIQFIEFRRWITVDAKTRYARETSCTSIANLRSRQRHAVQSILQETSSTTAEEQTEIEMNYSARWRSLILLRSLSVHSNWQRTCIPINEMCRHLISLFVVLVVVILDVTLRSSSMVNIYTSHIDRSFSQPSLFFGIYSKAYFNDGLRICVYLTMNKEQHAVHWSSNQVRPQLSWVFSERSEGRSSLLSSSTVIASRLPQPRREKTSERDLCVRRLYLLGVVEVRIVVESHRLDRDRWLIQARSVFWDLLHVHRQLLGSSNRRTRWEE